jgi:hypothetical protein
MRSHVLVQRGKQNVQHVGFVKLKKLCIQPCVKLIYFNSDISFSEDLFIQDTILENTLPL